MKEIPFAWSAPKPWGVINRHAAQFLPISEMSFSELFAHWSDFHITKEMGLLIFCGVSIAGLMYFLAQLTREIPQRLLIVLPIPLYLLMGVLAAIIYIWQK